jgi:hypothetical protein
VISTTRAPLRSSAATSRPSSSTGTATGSSPAAASCAWTGSVPGSSSAIRVMPRFSSARVMSVSPCATPDVITVEDGSATTPRTRPR